MFHSRIPKFVIAFDTHRMKAIVSRENQYNEIGEDGQHFVGVCPSECEVISQLVSKYQSGFLMSGFRLLKDE